MSTTGQVELVKQMCRRYGRTSIIALGGPPASGKSHIGMIAAQEFAGSPSRVKDIQFHQAFTYEEFIEGLRVDKSGAIMERAGAFLDWNDRAGLDPENNWVLMIEELTRANLAAVLGELLTYIEYRDRPFTTLFSRQPVKVAKNLTIMATFNPVDRSALNIDDALLRRMRIVDFLPDEDQLRDMLGPKGEPDARAGLPPHVIEALASIFERCRAKHGKDAYKTFVPFGHGIFSEVRDEGDLFPLWQQRIERILFRPGDQVPHQFAETIKEAYPWAAGPAVRIAAPVARDGDATPPAPDGQPPEQDA